MYGGAQRAGALAVDDGHGAQLGAGRRVQVVFHHALGLQRLQSPDVQLGGGSGRRVDLHGRTAALPGGIGLLFLLFHLLCRLQQAHLRGLDGHLHLARLQKQRAVAVDGQHRRACVDAGQLHRVAHGDGAAGRGDRLRRVVVTVQVAFRLVETALHVAFPLVQRLIVRLLLLLLSQLIQLGEHGVRLPLRLQTGRRREERIEEFAGLKALVVDDDFNTCDSVTKLLTRVGMRAEWTLSGREAVLRARQAIELGDPCRAYIIDWRLPDMNGIEVTRQIRSLNDDTPIIILTAYDWSDIEAEARAAGVTAFCSKPMFLSDLRDALLTATGHAPTAAEPDILPEAQADFRGRHVLLVEDNELNREIAVEILHEYGFLVDTAENGAIAVDKVRSSPADRYDLVLMDIQMPVMDGYTATQRIRALNDPARATVPIVAMTANVFEEERKRAFDCGMNAFLSKPLVIDALIATLRDILH